MLVSTLPAEPGQSINYMPCHDDLVLWDKLTLTMRTDDRLTKEKEKLGYLALFTYQGVPFFQGGEELGGRRAAMTIPTSRPTQSTKSTGPSKRRI